jgi:pyridoxal phosphate enzyme (YggS family)
MYIFICFAAKTIGAIMKDLATRIQSLNERISAASNRCGRSPDSVKTVVVTKTHPAETLQAVLDAGIADIGENKVQELIQKAPLLRGARTLHMVGHLQTNKVGKVVPLVDWIQSVDSERLLQKIDTQCENAGKKINILIQINTSAEESKSGCAPEEALELCEKAAASPHVEFRGLMTIGPLGGSEQQIRQSFIRLRELGEKCASLCAPVELSMGMSDDFEWAIEEGATIIRIGSLLLGERM